MMQEQRALTEQALPAGASIPLHRAVRCHLRPSTHHSARVSHTVPFRFRLYFVFMSTATNQNGKQS